jgi:protein-tyrosine-phosphatase
LSCARGSAAPPGVFVMTTPAGKRPQSVLFACTLNSVRSPIAEALGKHYFGRQIYFASAGVKPGKIDDFAVAVMDEIGIDLSKHRPHRFEDLEDSYFDLVVTLSPQAHHQALELTRTSACEVVYWPTLDATAVEGSREHILEAYRQVRESLFERIKTLFDYRPMGHI